MTDHATIREECNARVSDAMRQLALYGATDDTLGALNAARADADAAEEQAVAPYAERLRAAWGKLGGPAASGPVQLVDIDSLMEFSALVDDWIKLAVYRHVASPAAATQQSVANAVGVSATTLRRRFIDVGRALYIGETADDADGKSDGADAAGHDEEDDEAVGQTADDEGDGDESGAGGHPEDAGDGEHHNDDGGHHEDQGWW